MSNSITASVFLLILLSQLPSTLHAAVRMPQIFGDHMVLQQDTRLPVWGWAAPNEKVSVTFAGQKASAVAGADGKWRVNLTSIQCSDQGQVLTISGTNIVTFQDVVVGDVWLASGQSNMEWGIGGKKHYAADVENAADPLLRLFFVPRTTSLTPLDDILRWPFSYSGETSATTAGVLPDPWRAKWVLCTPQALQEINQQGFSTVAYFFAREIRATRGQPVGIIQSSWGGTRAEAWTSVSELAKNPPFTTYIQRHEKAVAAFPSLQETYPRRKAETDAALEKWKEEVQKPWDKAKDEWRKAASQARVAGQKLEPEPEPATPRPSPIHPPDNDTMTPGNLFNAMISPLMPYAIKGVIWYQGEFNSGFESGTEYVTLFPRLIGDWREKWGQGDFPFIYVQLANIGAPTKSPSESPGLYLWVREAQRKALSVPNTAMASAIDIGVAADPRDAHPPDKLDVAHRLVLAARHVAYGENIVFSGPLYQSMKVEGKKLRLHFTQCGSGLILGTSPETPNGQSISKQSKLSGFAIAGGDRKFVWADAVIDGHSVVVSSDQVTQPVAVRYDWAESPIGNLYNQENLPASPFRTDDWAEAK